MFKKFFEDFEIGSSETFGRYEVSREEIIEFASKYDPQPFHLNDEIAKMSPMGGLCASGWHTCSMTMRMMVDHLMQAGVAGVGSPGVDEIRWKTPCFPGDVLSVTSECIETRPSQSRANVGLVKSRHTVANQNGDTVMTMVSNVMILRRQS